MKCANCEKEIARLEFARGTAMKCLNCGKTIWQLESKPWLAVHDDTGLPRCYPALQRRRFQSKGMFKFLSSLVAKPGAVMVWQEERLP